MVGLLISVPYNYLSWAFQVYLYGAHVTSWKNDHGEELLFVSSKVLCSYLFQYFLLFCFSRRKFS